jgi:Tfp pilus assembly protein PilO
LNELLDNLLERPGKQKLAILAVIVVLLGALYYSFLYAPRAEELAKLADSIEIAQNEKRIKTQKSANLVRLR